MGPGLDKIKAGVTSAVSTVASGVTSAVKTATTAVTGAVSKVSEGISNIATPGMKKGGENTPGMDPSEAMQGAKSALEAAKPSPGDQENKDKKKDEEEEEEKKGKKKDKAKTPNIFKDLEKDGKKAKEAGEGPMEAVKGAGKDLMKAGKEAGGDLMKGGKELMGKISSIPGMEGQSSAAKDGLTDKLGKGLSSIANKATGLAKGAQEGVENLFKPKGPGM